MPPHNVSRTSKALLMAASVVAIPIIVGGMKLTGCSGSSNTSQDNPELARLEQQMFQAINQYRDSIGLQRLQWSEISAQQARLHSHAMAAGRIPLGHDGAEERTRQIGKKIQWTSISENVAFSTKRADIIPFLLERWLASPGHRKNIEGHFTLTGIGAALSQADDRYFFTQIFLLTE